MTTHWLRARRLLSAHSTAAIALLVVLAALGGWVTYATHVEPGTHVEQREASSWSTTAGFAHNATVTEPNPVYQTGTTLENRTVYFASVAPTLEGALTHEYATDGDGNLTVVTDAQLVFQRVERDREGAVQTRYWETTQPLDQRRVDDVAPGETVRVPFSVDVSALANRSERVSDELGETRGRTEALVRVDVALNGTVDGQRVDRTDRYTLPVVVGEAYRVSDPGTTGETYTTTREVIVENTYGPVRSAGGPLLFAGASLALVGLAAARSRGALALTPTERAYLDYRADREEFDEWINVISLPDGATDRPRAEASSLADLVDFAIDTNNSVMEDPEDGTCHVVHDGYRYVYEPPADPGETGASGSGGAGTGDSDDPGDPDDPLAPDPRTDD